MFKKLISGALSLSLLVSAAVSGNLNSLVTEQNRPSDDSVKNTDVSVEGINSVAKMMLETSDVKKDIQPLGSEPTENKFTIIDLNFSIDTGMLTVTTTQSFDCNLEVSFVDDEDNTNTINIEVPLKKGKGIVTEQIVDTQRLPEFFDIKAALVDFSGIRLCEDFYLQKYTKTFYEIQNKTIADFDEDYVVNLDDDTTTNFFVLSEDTIIADSSENVNTLVSADYDNGVYVFDNIDDSFDKLEEGDYFYIQPNQKDIIAVSVNNVSIDGNTVTLKGGGDIEDMFSFIKYEANYSSDGDEINYHYYPDENDIDEEISGVLDKDVTIENTPGILYEYDNSKSGGFSFSQHFGIDSKELDWLSDDTEFEYYIELEGSVGYEDNIYFYKKGKEVINDLKFLLNIDISVKVGGELTKELASIPLIPETGFFKLDLVFSVSVSGELSFHIKYECLRGYYLHTNNIDDDINGKIFEIYDANGDSDKSSPDLTAEGTVKITLGLDAGFKLINDDFANMSYTVNFGLEITSPYSIAGGVIALAKKGWNKITPDNVNVADIDKDELHLCTETGFNCVPYEIKFSIEGEPDISIFGNKLLNDLTNIRAKKEWDLGKAHWSLCEGFKFGECKNYAYKTTLTFVDQDGTPIMGADVSVDGKSTKTNGLGKAVLYCKEGEYGVSLSKNGSSIILPKSIITTYEHPFEYSFKITVNKQDDGSETYDSSEEFDIHTTSVKNDSIKNTTTTTKPSPTMPAEDFDCGKPKKSSIDLGETLSGSVFEETDEKTGKKSGYAYAYGYGEMNSNGFSDRLDITEAVIEDIGETIETQADKPEILINYYISSHQDELFEKYKNEHPDDIGTISAFDAALIYIKEHDEEYAAELEKYKKDLIEETNTLHITNLGAGTFAGCENIETIILPAHLERIDAYAFSNCTNLKSITYEGSPNAGKKAIDLPPTLKSVGNYAFKNCISLKGEVSFSDQLEQIGEFVFTGCTGITKISILNPSCQNEEGFMFAGCTSLEEVTVPEVCKDYFYKFAGDSSAITPTLKK